MKAGIAAGAGFALAAAFFGTALNVVVTLASGRLPSDAGGSIAAVVLFAAIGYGAMALCGGAAVAILVGLSGRLLGGVGTSQAMIAGLLAGVITVLAASAGALSHVRMSPAGAGAIAFPAAIAGVFGAALVIGWGLARR